MSFVYEDTGQAGPVDLGDLAATSYENIPYIPRRWLQGDYLPVGTVTVYAAEGETGKGMLMCANAARTVLGLPFPNEDQDIRRDPGRVVWITGPGEDDPFEDLAARLRAAIAAAVAEFGLDPLLAEEKTGAIRFIHDLSVWPDDSPVTLPADRWRILAEIGKLNKLNRDNQPCKPGEEPGPPVALVVADSLSALLSAGYTIDSRQGAVRTMVALNQFARRADVAFPVLHHLTKDGKVAGSVGVLNAVRLAFVIKRDATDENIRVITRHKSNIAAAEALSYTISGNGPSVRAVFVSAEDARAARVSDAQRAAVPDAPAAGSVRARLAAAQEQDREGGPFRLLRETREPGGGRPARGYVGGPYATRSEARAAAVRDAGMVLDWQRGEGSPHEAATLTRADGASRGYGVVPARPRERVGANA